MKAINYYIGIYFRIFFLCLLLLLPSLVFSQALKGGIVEGDKVPDVQINHTTLTGGKTITFSQLKGKLVILDFWNVYCTACIDNMPHMDSLQVKFGDKVQIILVTKGKAEQVDKLFKRIGVRAPHLLSITNDTVLNKLFPHYGEPHHVWIDPKGIYRLATFDFNTTEKNIQQLLTEDKLSMTPRKTGMWKEDQPFLSQMSDAFLPHVFKSSILMKGLGEYADIQGYGVFMNDSITNWQKMFRGVNLTPVQLIQVAFDKDTYGYDVGLLSMKTNKRMIIEVANKGVLYQPTKRDQIDQWVSDNFWSWEIRIEPKSEGDLIHYMQRELNETLPYRGAIEMRKVKYWALVKKGYNDGDRAMSAKNRTKKIDFRKGFASFINTPMVDIVRQLNYLNETGLPIIDETGITTSMDFKIAFKEIVHIDSLKAALNKLGLDLVERKGKLKMLVVRDNINMLTL